MVVLGWWAFHMSEIPLHFRGGPVPEPSRCGRALLPFVTLSRDRTATTRIELLWFRKLVPEERLETGVLFTGVTHLQENALPPDPAVGLCLGS